MVIVADFADKWCPYSTYGVGNRDDDGQLPTSSYCMGEACMAWRWFMEDKGLGYCGAFGNPSHTIKIEEDDDES